MGAVNTTYTFTATDTITSTKMNNIIDETVMTTDAVLSSGGLEIASGKLAISANAINSSRLAAGSVSNTNVSDTAAIAGTKISPNFGSQNIVTTGTLDVGTSSFGGTFLKRANTTTEGGDLAFAKAIDNTVGFTIDCFGSTSTPDLRFITGSSVAATLTTSGNLGIGTTTPSYLLDVSGTGFPTARVASTYTASGKTYSSLVMGAWTGTNTGVQTGFVTDSSSLSNSFYHVTPWGSTEGFNFKLSSSGRVGISVAGEPSSTLQVGGTVTATAFAGPLTGNVTGDVTGNVTGNVTGDVTGSSGSCTGNSATATLATKASTLSNGGGNGNAMTFHYSGQGGQPTWIWGSNDAGGGSNNYVWNPAYFSVNYANSAGSAGSATTASTVSNGAITAAKLDGAQSGSAPIYGCRAWVSFAGRSTNGDCTIRSAGNVYRVARTAEGRYTVYFTTAMQDAEYATITGSDANFAHKIAGVFSQAAGEVNIAYSQIQTATSRIDPTWGQVSIFR